MEGILAIGLLLCVANSSPDNQIRPEKSDFLLDLIVESGKNLARSTVPANSATEVRLAMDQASSDPLPPSAEPPPSANQVSIVPYEPHGKLLIWTRRFVCLSLAFLGICIVATMGGRLWRELGLLSAELADARNREPMGYLGISSEQPEAKPPSCICEVDGHVLLWAGSGVKGQAGWFDVSATGLPLKQFVYAFGRDKIRTIDYPILQNPDGEIARRIYPERPVLGIVVGSEARAYPLTVMEKVEVVNDTIEGVPLAIAYLPLMQKHIVFQRTLDGTPISLGTSGYVYQDAFVLYDRGTDSLWYPKEEGLTAITGPLVGKVLKPATQSIERIAWGKWQRRYPNTQVLVGADRSRGIPIPSTDEVASRSL
jgi:hypothetical protein